MFFPILHSLLSVDPGTEGIIELLDDSGGTGVTGPWVAQQFVDMGSIKRCSLTFSQGVCFHVEPHVSGENGRVSLVLVAMNEHQLDLLSTGC